jgi:transglutaminase-like putative cysteine protease
MNDLRSNRFVRLLRDDRSVLGTIVLGLVWFVGSTFNTKAATFTWFVTAIVIAMIIRLFDRHSKSGRDTNLRVKSNQRAESPWRQVGKALLLVASLGGSSFLVFNWRFLNRINEGSSLLVLSVDTIGHCCVAMACLLWAIHSQRGHVLLLVVGMVAVLMGVAGGGVSATLTAQTAVGLVSCVGFLVAAQIIVGRSIKSTRVSHRSLRKGWRFAEVLSSSPSGIPDATKERFSFSMSTWPFTLLTLSLILILASATARVAEFLLPQVQAEVFSQLKDRFEDSTSAPSFAGGRYVSGNRIGEVQKSLLTDPNGLALRGYCNGSPGYLRGNVFDDYWNGRWATQRRWSRQIDSTRRREGGGLAYRSRIVERISDAKVPPQEDAHPVRARFPLNVFDETDPFDPSDGYGFANQNQLEGEAISNETAANRLPPIVGMVEIYGQPDRGQQSFFPANSIWIEGKAKRIGVTPHRLIDRGLDTNQPWVVGVTAEPMPEPLNASERGLMLWVDPRIRPFVQKVSKDVAGGASNTRTKASLVANYFQTRYAYTLRTKASPKGVDPIVHFLTTRHAAHCEFFASASALMLRTLDVPTRYVTGYVMDELSDSEDYYLARNRDAHAWVEYYDESTLKWLSLETTPGRTFQTLRRSTTPENTTSADSTGKVDESRSTSWLRGLVGYFASLRLTDTLSILFQFLQIPALVLLVGWLWWHAREERGDLQAQLRSAQRGKMDRRVRRWGWVRHTTETLHQFAARLESVPPDHPRFNDLQSASDWYRRHAVDLYRGTPSPQ